MELKPCPFCGGEIRIVRLHGSYGEPWYARCDRCEVSGYYYKTEAQAIEAWSDRAERTCHVESMHGYTDHFASTRYSVELSCHTLEDWPDSEPPEYCPWCGARVVEEVDADGQG